MRLILTAAGLAAAVAVIVPAANAQTKPKPTAGAVQPVKAHRVVIQITQNDPAMMNTALNNAENLAKFYQSRGETVEVEFVAYGPGLAMVRSDTSPVKDRIASIAGSMKNVTFSGCENTMAAQSKAESKQVTLLADAKMVPTGIGRIVELQERGWTYVRP